MASTLIIYQGTGSQTDFAIPFDYLKKSFVTVSLQGTPLTGGDYGDTGADYYFLDKTKIRLKKAPASGQLLTVRRYTSQTQRVVSFKDASVLKATDLDASQLQAFHIAAEARDIINDALIQDKFDNWDAKNHRIVNLADPQDPQDAVTYKVYKQDAQGAYQSKLKAQKAKNTAKEWATKLGSKVNNEDYSSKYYAQQSSKSATASANSASSAKSSADTATTKASQAASSASTATTKASQASASASKAKTSETNAKKSETNAKSSENKAKTSETNAKASETNAKASQDQATRQAQLAKEYANTASKGQFQADWAQSNSSKKSYIKNKPNLDLYAKLQQNVLNYGLGGGQGTAADLATIYGSADLNLIDKTGFYTVAGNTFANTPNGDKSGVVLHIQRRFQAGASAMQLYTSSNGLIYYRVRNQNTNQASVLHYTGEMTNEKMDAMNKDQQQAKTTAAITSKTWTSWYEITANDNGRGLNINYIRTLATRWGITHMNGIPTKGSLPSTNLYAYHGVYDGSKNLDNAQNRLGVVQFGVTKDGTTQYQLIAYQNKAGSQVTSAIGTGVKADGRTFTYAPTPANTSNDTNIATTAFTQAVLGELKTGLTGGSVIPAKAKVADSATTATNANKAKVADSALKVAWDNVTGKPDSYSVPQVSGDVVTVNDVNITINAAQKQYIIPKDAILWINHAWFSDETGYDKTYSIRINGHIFNQLDTDKTQITLKFTIVGIYVKANTSLAFKSTRDFRYGTFKFQYLPVS